jgi:small-conductance mechanosensitive channel
MINILHSRYHKYLHAFSAIVVLYLIIVVVSPETSLYRLLMMFIAVIETGLIVWLLINLKKNKLFNEKQRRYLFIFIALHLCIALAGMGSNLAGSVTLTEICINAVFSNIFYGMIIFISVIIINGLLAAGIDSSEGQRVNAIRIYGELIKERSIILLNGVAILAWFLSILNAFRADAKVISGLHTLYTYKFTLGTASFSLDLVVVFFLVLFASYYLAQMLQIVLEKDLLNRIPLSKGLPHTISMGVKYVLIVSGFLLALNVSGIPMDKITIILGAFSVGIGFGLQNIFSNMVSGLILLFERPIQLGDTVQVGNLTGDVKSIDLRSSNIQTFDGAEVIVPNGQLISNEVINWTLSNKQRRVEIPVGVDYSSDPTVVHGLFMNILNQHNSVLKDPEPVVFFSGLGESSLDFTLVFWISDYSLGRSVKSDVLFEVFRSLKENGINIPFPQRDVHIV